MTEKDASCGEDLEQARQDVMNYLAFLKRAGFSCLVPSGKKGNHSAHERAEKLEILKSKVTKCMACKLSGGRSHVVFGEGNPDADIMFVGEGPGHDEDVQGRPFVGRSGKLLDQMMGEVGLRREDVFIANVVKCRPPENRNPEPDEIAECEPFLLAQIELVQPKVIIALGAVASHCLMRNTTPITQMRGKFFLYHEVKLMPTLHPAAVLRNMNYYKSVVEDLRRAVDAVGE